MVKRSTGVARTVWVAKSECCQKQYYSNIGFLTWLKLLPLALCVNKFTHINIVDFFITRSITSNKFALSSLNQEIRLLAIFNGSSIENHYSMRLFIAKGNSPPRAESYM